MMSLMEHTHESAPDMAHEGKEKKEPLSLQHALLWNAVIIGASVIIGACIVAGVSFGTPRAADTGGAKVAKVDVKDVNTEGSPFIGNPAAPAVMAYWSDFQCPYCKKFEQESFQSVIKDYVATGKLAVVFKDFSFLGPDSETAALYGRAVWELYPEQYFPWREAMFQAQDEEHGGFGDESSVAKLTGTIAGIDGAKVRAQVAAKKDAYLAAITADREEGVQLGITGTPSVIVGTEPIGGFNPYSTYKTAIEKTLK